MLLPQTKVYRRITRVPSNTADFYSWLHKNQVCIIEIRTILSVFCKTLGDHKQSYRAGLSFWQEHSGVPGTACRPSRLSPGLLPNTCSASCAEAPPTAPFSILPSAGRGSLSLSTRHDGEPLQETTIYDVETLLHWPITDEDV